MYEHVEVVSAKILDLVEEINYYLIKNEFRLEFNNKI